MFIKVLSRNKNEKYMYIRSNNSNFLHILQVLRREVHMSRNAFIAFNALNPTYFVCFQYKFRAKSAVYFKQRYTKH